MVDHTASHMEVHQQLKTQLGIERTDAHRMEGYFVLNTVFIFNSHLHGQKKNMRNILLIDNTLHQSI